MKKRKPATILIALLALLMLTQVLYGQIICDLMMSMPCCGTDAAPTGPAHPANHCDQCVVSGPLATGSFILESKCAMGHSNQALLILHPEVTTQVAIYSSAGVFHSSTSSPPLLSTSNTPETLSTFRI